VNEDSSLPPLLGEPEPPEIDEIHRAIVRRERPEPKEGLEPAPWWVWAISVFVLFAMGFYLGRYGGSFTAEAHQLEQRPAVVQAASAPAVPQGDIIYSGICQPCHQAGGVGLESRYPPLAGSEWVAKPPAVVARIVLHGLQGPIQVKGKTYTGDMPALAGQLEDEEIAAVLTYVRTNFGNKAGPVPVEVVKAARAENRGPWTAAALESLP